MPRMQQEIVSGPIARTIARLAWPVIAAEGLHVAFHLVDVAWVGPLGSWATGAVLTSMFVLWIVFAFAQLVMVGLGAHVARAIGAGDRSSAGHAVAQSLWLAGGLSLLVAVGGGAFAGRIFDGLGVDPDVARAGTTYLRISCLAAPFSFAMNALGAAMRACGNTRTPLLVALGAIAVDVALTPLLVYGPGPFPEWGVAGSAIATLVAMAAGAAAYVVLAVRSHPDLPIDRASLRRPDPALLASLARVGSPYCAVGILYSLVYLWYSHLGAAVSTAALAVVGIANRLESITYLSGDGFGVATATFVGQNLGAKEPGRAARGAWIAAGTMTCVGVACGLAFMAFPEALISLFTRDAEVMAIGAPYVRVLGICQVTTGLEAVLGGAFAGAGDTVPPLVIHVAFSIARIPLAWWAVVPMGLGPMGIAWTMTLTSLARGVVFAWWFSRGRWKLAQLPGARPLPLSEEPDAAL